MLKLKNNLKYRLLADPPDWRDIPYDQVRAPLREQVDLRPWASRIEDQGHLGSCVSNAVAGVYELLINLEMPDKFVDLSRLFVYYNARLIEDSVNDDAGVYVRDGIKSLKKYGVCAESIWPYDISKFAMTPSVGSYEDANTRNIKNYYRLSGLNDMLDALNNNRPVIFGMEAYASFDDVTADHPILAMPLATAEPLGAHAMCLVGYDLKKELVLARNSFGIHWGLDGYCWIPFDYVKSEFMDIWVFDIELKT